MDREKDHKPLTEVVSDAKDKVKETLTQPVDEYLTISQFRKELGIPLILAKKMVSWGMVVAFEAVDGTLRISGDQVEKARKFLENPWTRTKLVLKSLGPGLITGASDDDPSGIGTYASVGAQFGFAMLWMCAWLLPMMAAIQEVCARIGIVTNKGLAGVLQKYYHRRVVLIAVLLLVVANVVNISADIGAMAASLRLFMNVNFALLAVIIALLVVLVEVFVPYKSYVKILKWLSISLLGYIITGFIVHPDWLLVLKEAFVPYISFNEVFIFGLIAFFGTTITPYLFFWQTSEEVEEAQVEGISASTQTPRKIKSRIAHRRTDIKAGMFISNLVSFFIILTTATVLNRNGIFNIETASQAAEALRPLAGNYAFLLFALGIIGTGLLAVPILAGSCAYALAEVMNWNEGLDKPFKRAKSFYGAIAVSVLLGLLLNFVGVPPMKMLYYAAYLNGLISAPLLIIIMVVGNNKKVVGEETHPGWVKFFGWMAVLFAVVAVGASIVLAIR